MASQKVSKRTEKHAVVVRLPLPPRMPSFGPLVVSTVVPRPQSAIELASPKALPRHTHAVASGPALTALAGCLLGIVVGLTTLCAIRMVQAGATTDPSGEPGRQAACVAPPSLR
jgi:hypothetical protein